MIAFAFSSDAFSEEALSVEKDRESISKEGIDRSLQNEFVVRTLRLATRA